MYVTALVNDLRKGLCMYLEYNNARKGSSMPVFSKDFLGSEYCGNKQCGTPGVEE